MEQANSGVDPVLAALQQWHRAVISEELPDRFAKILDEIDASIAGKSDDQR